MSSFYIIFPIILMFIKGTISKEDDEIRALLTGFLSTVNEGERMVKIDNLTTELVETSFKYGRKATRAEFSILMRSGKSIKSHIILDGYPTSESGDKLVGKNGLMSGQIRFLQEVLPQLENLEIEVNDQSERFWVQSFGVKNNIVLLEDIIKDKNYSRPDMKKGLDLKHSELTVVTLGKYHAMSAVLVERGLIDLKNYDQSLFQKNQEEIKNYHPLFLTYLADSIEAKWGPEWNQTASVLRGKAKTVTEDMLKMYQRNDSAFNVLNYGGFTIMNILFAYGITDVYESQDPIAMKVEPPLNAYYNSPALDLQTFLRGSTDLEVKTGKKDQLIQLYHSSLSKYLDKFNFKGTRVKRPTLDDIKKEMGRTEYLGLVHSFSDLCYSYLDLNEILEIQQTIPKMTDKNNVVIDPRCLYGKQVEPPLNAYYNSPALDLQTFLRGSTDLEVKTGKKAQLIQLYHSSLSKYLDKFNFKGTRVKRPTLDDIKKEMGRTEYLGLVHSFSDLCYSYLDLNEILEIQQTIPKMTDKNNVVIDPRCLYGKQYIETMKAVLKLFISSELI